MKFTIEIELGNDAVQTAEDVAEILRATSAQVTDIRLGSFRNIRDLNGNTVGLWQVVEV